MAHRTTLLFDDESRHAAKQLALRYDCSTCEAVRRAVIQQRDQAFGVTSDLRHQRVEALEKLFELFDGHDADAEIRRLKAEDEHLRSDSEIDCHLRGRPPSWPAC